MRIIGLDIHRAFAEAVALEDGICRRLGRIGMTRDQLEAFAESLQSRDHVVVECTGNATAVLDILAPKVERVAVANPFQVHLIARAKTKTDKIDARVLAKLYAAGFLPEVWIPDAATQARRRQVTRRKQLVKSRARLKAIVQSILHAHLAPRCPHTDLFGGKGRAWLRAQVLPEDERVSIECHLEEYDRQTAAQKAVERDIAGIALDDANVRRLMTIPGIDMVVAVGMMAAIGRNDRFAAPEKLVAYLGLNPSVRQSGDGRAHHGRITKRGSSQARHLLVEAAWQIPGVGIITATALAASVPDPSVFRSGRQFAAWLGLVPRQNSSGGKDRLGRVSKIGNGYLRRLLVVGATSVTRRAATTDTRTGAWVRSLLERKPTRLVTVAIANKTARTAWALLAKGDVLPGA